MHTLRGASVAGDLEGKPGEAVVSPAAEADRAGVRKILNVDEAAEMSPEQVALAELQDMLHREKELSAQRFTLENLSLIGVQQMVQYFGLPQVTGALKKLAKENMGTITWHSLVDLLEPDREKRQVFYGKMPSLAKESWSDDVRRENPQLEQAVELHAGLLQARDTLMRRFFESRLPMFANSKSAVLEGAVRLVGEVDIDALLVSLEAANGDFLATAKTLGMQKVKLSVERQAGADALIKKLNRAIAAITAAEQLAVEQRINPLLERLQKAFTDGGFTERDLILAANADATEASIKQLNTETSDAILKKTQALRDLLDRAQAIARDNGASDLTL